MGSYELEEGEIVEEPVTFFPQPKFSCPSPSATSNNMGLQQKKRKEVFPAQVFEDNTRKETSLASQVNNTRKKMKVTTKTKQKHQQPSQVNNARRKMKVKPSQVDNAKKKIKVTATKEEKHQQPSQVNFDRASHSLDERVKRIFGNFNKGLEGGRVLCKETLGLYGQYGSLLPIFCAGSYD